MIKTTMFIRGVVLMAVGSLGSCLLPIGVAAAAPGDLDLSYGAGTGSSRIDLGQAETADAVALQPDGKIIVAGTTRTTGTGDVVVARLNNPQGSLDSSFGAFNGISRIDLGQTEYANALALQPDGKMIVAGTRTASGGSSSQAFVARLTNPAALLDTTYGQGSGWSAINFPGFDQASANAVALQPDGKVVVAGDTASGTAPKDVLVARLNNPAGTFDSSYGLGTGGSRVDLGDDETANAIALQPDGKILVAGTQETTPPGSGTSDHFVVMRLLGTQGTLDDSFKPAALTIDPGSTTIDFGHHSVARAMVLQPDGKILVAGYTDATGTDDFAVARLQSNGSLDKSFGTGGKTTLDFGGSDQASAMVVQPDGKIVLVGTTARGPADEIAASRLQPDGTPDRTFGTDGKTIVDAKGALEFASAVALQPDGKIVIAGTVTGNGYDMLVVRLQGDPRGGGGGGGGGGGAGGGGNGGGGRPTRPILSRVRQTADRWLAGDQRAAISRKRRLPVGTTFTLALNEAATVKFAFTQATHGRRVGSRCVTVTRRNTHSRRCTRTVIRGALSFAGHPGVNRVRFAGRLSRNHTLAPGRYTLVLTAISAARQRSTPRQLTFTILRAS